MNRLYGILLCILWINCYAQHTEGFSIDTITPAIHARMLGKSYPIGCPVPLKELRYLRMLHYNAEGKVCKGEMVCNRLIAKDIIDIFEKLYQNHYPIERIKLIDDYNADDIASMQANNTSSFCYRRVKGSKVLSKHSRGMAVDINTLYNPYYKRNRQGKITVNPPSAYLYINRKKNFKYKINKNDLCYRLFIGHGFKWGGNWHSVKDWQHFEK